MTGTPFINQSKKLQMLFHFIETDTKLLVTWLGSIAMILVNKFGFNIQDYEIWKIMILDILTGLSLLVAMGYTIARWRKLIKQGKENKPKIDNTN